MLNTMTAPKSVTVRILVVVDCNSLFKANNFLQSQAENNFNFTVLTLLFNGVHMLGNQSPLFLNRMTDKHVQNINLR